MRLDARTFFCQITFQMGMLEETRALLQRNKQPRWEIATHAGVNYHWLVKFESDPGRDPRVGNLEKLHQYLKGKSDG